jgi:hypothetical protein
MRGGSGGSEESLAQSGLERACACWSPVWSRYAWALRVLRGICCGCELLYRVRGLFADGDRGYDLSSDAGVVSLQTFLHMG